MVGFGNEDIAGARAATDFGDLKACYQAHRVYLNTDPQGRLHLSALEAMATGMPLVSPPIADLAPYVEDGTSAFMSADEGRLREALEQLLADLAIDGLLEPARDAHPDRIEWQLRALGYL